MKITDALRGEHAVLYVIFDFVRDTISNSEDITIIKNSVSVLERTLLSHAEIEDNFLFPELDPHIAGMGPLEMMRTEHQSIDEILKSYRDENDVDALKALIRQLIDLAFGHFQKEEMALFAMAEQFLTDDELTALGDKWAEKRNVVVDGHSCISAA
jgi:hemerythrin-like domain-containing protein|tara:strand:+ start:5031 stop:5498 length:468 start_codon:yes stop_codon:yes gene_type:complete